MGKIKRGQYTFYSTNKKYTVPVLFAVAFALIFSAALASTAAESENAVIVQIKGEAFLVLPPKATRLALGKDSTVRPGATIAVSKGAKVTIKLPDKSKIELGPELTTVRYDGRRLKTISFTLFEGRMRNDVTPLKGDAAYTIATPAAVVGVRGTEFLIEVAENGAARTSVAKGIVAVDAGNGEAEFEKGEVSEAFLLEPESNASDWYQRNQVQDSSAAEHIESEVSGRLEDLAYAAAAEYERIAELRANITDLIANIASNDVESSDILRLSAEGLTLFREQSRRRQSIDAQYAVSDRLAKKFKISVADSRRAYDYYNVEASKNTQSLDGFIAALEKLATLAATAEALSAASDAAGEASTPLDKARGFGLPF